MRRSAVLSIVLIGGFLIKMRNNMINLIGKGYQVTAEAKVLPDGAIFRRVTSTAAPILPLPVVGTTELELCCLEKPQK